MYLTGIISAGLLYLLMKWQFVIWLDDLPQPISNTNTSRFCSLPAKSSGQCVSACFQLRKKSLSHPHTAMNVAQGTRMSGRSRRPRGYVYLTLSNITDRLAANHLGYFSPTLFPLSVWCHYNSAVSYFSVWPQMRTNVPSWCDRILWKSYPETHIVCNSYGEMSHSTRICFNLV